MELLRIVHADESVGVYGHLAHNGALAKVGDTVEEGQHIGFSGNSGASSGPHLHFHVMICCASLGWCGVEIAFKEQQQQEL